MPFSICKLLRGISVQEDFTLHKIGAVGITPT